MSIRLQAKNFRSYPSIDWKVPSGLTLIDGMNMAGKTTLLDAWFWCRYGWLPRCEGPKGGPADNVIRRKAGETHKPCWVQVTEKVGSDEIEIRRERPHRLVVKKNGIVKDGINQEELEKMLGMSAARFLVIVYMPQKRKQSFYKMSDADRTTLLSVVAGLEELDKALAEAKAMKHTSEMNAQSASASVSIFESQLKDFPSRIDRLNAQKAVAEAGHVQAVALLDTAKKSLIEMEPILISERDSKIKEESVPLFDRMSSLRLEVADLIGKTNGLKQKLLEVPKPEVSLVQDVIRCREAVSRARTLEKEVLAIERSNERIFDKIRNELEQSQASRNGKCSECGRLFDEWDRNAHAKEHIDKAESLKTGLKPVPALPDTVSLEAEFQKADDALRKRTAELEVLPSQLRSELSTLEAKIDHKWSEIRSIERDVKNVEDRVKRDCTAKLEALHRGVRDAETEGRHQEQLLRAAESALHDMMSQRKAVENSLTRSREELDIAQDGINEALDLVELFGPKGYRAVCYDGLVDRISDRAGQLLRIMTDDVYSTYLKQVSEDSKGNQKLILKPIVLKGGQEVSFDDLSGGAEDRISLAYDVAISDVAGEGMPLLLDEALSGLDAAGKMEAMTLLEEVARTRPVLVIDHTSEFKALFNQIIRVVYQDEESSLEIA